MEDIIVLQGHITATIIHLMGYQKHSTNSEVLKVIICLGYSSLVSSYWKIKFILKNNFYVTKLKEISYFLTLPCALQRGKYIKFLILRCQGKEKNIV